MGKYSNHNAYFFNSKEVPSVTTILKILSKPTLVKWANFMGFKRRLVDDILEESSDIGTNVHMLVETFLMKRKMQWVDTKYSTKELMILYFNQFLNWYKQHEVEPIFMEESHSSELFGGTIDFYGIIDGKKTVLDFKTSKNMYSSMFLQLSAYVHMLELQDMEVEQVAILSINKNKFRYKVMSREDIEKYRIAFLSLAQTFAIWYDINIEDGWGDILGK